MLTKKDLQSIGELIDTKLDEKLESKLEQKLKPIRKSLKRLDSIEKKLDTTIRFFDNTAINHEKRIKRVEKHLNLPALAD